jgi:hexulose-6-phosphate isomerase
VKKSIVQGFFGKQPLEDVFKRLKAANYDGLQVAMRATAADGEVNLEMSDAEVRRIRRAAQARGLKLHSIMPQTGVSLASAKAAERRTCVAHFKRMLELAKGLGCENILCHPGHVAAETPYDAFYGWVVEGLRALAPAARKAGIPLLLENVWNRFMYSPLEAKQILADVGSRAVGIYLDLGNIIPFGWPEHWFRMLGRRIGEVHIKDFRRQVMSGAGFVYPLMGDVDWVAVMRELRRIKYSGWLCAEYGPYPQFADKALWDISTSIDAILALP